MILLFKTCWCSFKSLVSLVSLDFVWILIPFSFCSPRCPSPKHHLWLLQEARYTGNAVEMQNVLWLWLVHTVLHEQQARSVSLLRALWDSTLAAVSRIWTVRDANRAIFPFKARTRPLARLLFGLGSRIFAVGVKRELGGLPVNLPALVLSCLSCLTFTKRCSADLECPGRLFGGRWL